MIEITLTANDANRRLDRFLGAYLRLAPKSLLQKWLRKKRIKLNGKRAAGQEITAAGDVVTLYLSLETIESFKEKKSIGRILRPVWSQTQAFAARPSGPVDVLYEDAHIILLNKAAGLLTHAKKPGSQDTLQDRLLSYLHSKGAYDPSHTFKPALCNRLDRNTSGLVAGGKQLAAVQELTALIREGKVEKQYMAVVQGRLEGQGALQGYLRKDEKLNRSYISKNPSPDAAAVRTEYTVLCAKDKYSLLRVKLLTGKPHQIRAHFSCLGHPLAGDVKYGGAPVPGVYGQLLHAYTLAFLDVSPNSVLGYLSGQKWYAPLPKAFASFLQYAKLEPK